jgi:hypothetical protein
MKELLAKKQSADQKKSNDFARYNFILAMMNMDEKMVGPLLKENSKFLGYMNNWQLLHWLKNQFDTLNTRMFHSKFEEGISLDYYPGSEMYEFSYAPMSNSENDIFQTYDEYQDSIFKNDITLKIKLVLLFENGKICDMRIPNRVASVEKITKFQNDN